MKRTIAFLLALSMMFTLCACGGGKKKVYEKAKEAYKAIDKAYEGTNIISTRIYEAWYQCITNGATIDKLAKNKKGDEAIAYLADEIDIKKEYLIAGGRKALYSALGVSPDNLPEETKTQIESIISAYDENPNMAFTIIELINKITKKSLSKADFVVSATIFAIEEAGITNDIQLLLDEAKGLMKEMSEKYSDYEHYANLKGYYTTTSSFFDYCQHPKGSFEQNKDTMNDYRNKARDYQADLSFIFEE